MRGTHRAAPRFIITFALTVQTAFNYILCALDVHAFNKIIPVNGY
jgi:hypothetical protein